MVSSVMRSPLPSALGTAFPSTPPLPSRFLSLLCGPVLYIAKPLLFKTESRRPGASESGLQLREYRSHVAQNPLSFCSLSGVVDFLPPIRIQVIQGNRVKKLCGDKACEEVVIPGGDFAAESEGILSPGSPD